MKFRRSTFSPDEVTLVKKRVEKKSTPNPSTQTVGTPRVFREREKIREESNKRQLNRTFLSINCRKFLFYREAGSVNFFRRVMIYLFSTRETPARHTKKNISELLVIGECKKKEKSWKMRDAVQ